ncbi:hypothetical protein WL77_14820 [Burkholderia ubonensis]|nr:hypothetical protein WL79_28385 [Burkholderia ubonensis]KWE67277.1 hypothetical protein WL77_14820 [Burkholderia ubonensis]
MVTSWSAVAGYALRTYQFDAGSPDGAYKGWRLASELLLEQVRRDIAPHLPSRWDCTFAIADRAQAIAQMQLWNPSPRLYQVELVIPGAVTHMTDWHRGRVTLRTGMLGMEACD